MAAIGASLSAFNAVLLTLIVLPRLGNTEKNTYDMNGRLGKIEGRLNGGIAKP